MKIGFLCFLVPVSFLLFPFSPLYPVPLPVTLYRLCLVSHFFVPVPLLVSFSLPFVFIPVDPHPSPTTSSQETLKGEGPGDTGPC